MERPLLDAQLLVALRAPQNLWHIYEICKTLALSPESCLTALQELAPELPIITVLRGVNEYRSGAWPELVARGMALMEGACLPVAVGGVEGRTV